MKLRKFLELVNRSCYERNCHVGKCPFADSNEGQNGVYCLIDLQLLSEGEDLYIDKILKNVKKYEKRSKRHE